MASLRLALLQTAGMTDLSPAVTSTHTNNNISVTVSATFRPFVAWPFLPTNVLLRRTVQHARHAVAGFSSP